MRLFYCFFAVLIILLTTSCKSVSEDNSALPDIPSAAAPLSETEITSVSEITSKTEITSATRINSAAETTSKTEITSGSSETASTVPETTADETSSAASDTELAKTVRETEETTSETTETSAVSETTTTQTETSALTLQYESPYESELPETRPAASYGSRNYKALNFREQKGFWITYLEYMSILKNKSESSFAKSVGEYFDNISALGFNTVYVQVRAFGDAYYDSELFPAGEQYNGTIGSGSGFDALEIMVKAAHERGLSVHAWVNPMRLMTSAQIENISDKYQIKNWYDNKNGTYIVKSGDRWYLNPAYDEVTELIADGISEIVSGYDVDGVQIDDYFYPTAAADFDKAAYSASGTALSLSDWRLENVNKLVKKLYKAVHSANSTAVFGISPQGSVENDYKAFADVRTWCSQSGYCDYILPQVYFGFENATLPYADVISEWSGMVKNSNVKLVIGLAAYKIGVTDNYAGAKGKNEWTENNDIISRQMKLAETLGNYGGVALYRYESVFAPASDVSKAVSKELENIEK